MEKSVIEIKRELTEKLNKAINVMETIVKKHPNLPSKAQEQLHFKIRQTYTYRSKLEKFGFIEPTIDLIKADLIIEFVDYMQLGICIALDVVMQNINAQSKGDIVITDIENME